MKSTPLPEKKKACKHLFQILSLSIPQNAGGGTMYIAVCTKCLEKRNL